MRIDPTDPRPAYRQIADDLRSAIHSRQLAPVERIPSVRELAERYGTAPQTVKQAINLLKSEGLLVGEPGRGVFVRERALKLRLDATHRFITQARAQGQTGEVRLLDVQVVPAPSTEIAAKLNLDEDEQVVVRGHLLLLDDEPVQLVNSYWPASLAEGTPIAESAELKPGRIDAVLKERHGIEPTTFVDELTVRMPTPEETRALRLLPGTPIVSLLRAYHDAYGNPFEAADFVLAGDKHILVYEGKLTNAPSTSS
jgi:GntR family transcriptional regulator